MKANSELFRRVGAMSILVIVVVSSANAQLPASKLDGLFPAGAAPGSTLEVTISGTNLDETDKLVFSQAGIRAALKMADPTPFDEGPQRVENTFVVTVDANTPPGRYEVRSQGKYGLSNSRIFVIGSQAEFTEIEPNGANELPRWTEIDDGAGGKTKKNLAGELILPATINGQLTNGADVDWFRFHGINGSRVLLDGFTKRIDSRMDMIISLYAADGDMIGEGRTSVSGDPLLDATLPADGEYFIKVHDVLFRNGNGFHYRLSVGSPPHLEFVFPPAGLPGSNEEYTVYGCNLPGGSNSDWSIDGRRLEMAKVRIAFPDVTDKLEFSSLLGPHQSGLDGFEYRMTNHNAVSNPLLITAATAPILLEQADNDRPEIAQKLTPPCEVAGQFFPLRDVDWFTFDAKKDDVWLMDLFSHRLGVMSDASLLIQRVAISEAGEQQISDVQFIDDIQTQNFNNHSGRHEFDARTTDPAYLFTAPADGTYRVLLKDGPSSVHSDPRLVYRFAIRKPAPDFRIVAVPSESNGSLLLRRGLREVVRVHVFRTDRFEGEIRVACEGLPQGVSSEEITIGPANTMGTLILTTSSDAPVTNSVLKISAKATVNGQEVVRKARYGAALEPFQFAQPNAIIASVPSRMVDNIQLCVTDYEPLPLLLTIGEGKPLETSRGGVLKIPYQVTKGEGITANLIAFLSDFPPQTSVPQVNIGANEKGDFELRFQAGTPPGTYTLYLAGFNQNYSYRRNPESAERAKQRQELIGKIFTQSQEKTTLAQQEATKRQQELQASTNAFNAAKTQTQQTNQAVVNTESANKAAEEQLKLKQAAVAANAADATLQAQAAQAQATVEQASKALADSKAAAAEALKKQELADVLLQTAQTTKTQADKDLQSAREFQQLAQQEKQRADQFVNQKNNESTARGINFNVPSNSLTIKIADFPITLETLSEALTVNQGQKIEVPIKLARLYGFTSGVNVQVQLAGGVGGIGIQQINIADGQAEGKFEITAQPTATVGEHVCTVRLQMNFNGQNLVMERPLKLTVVEVKPN